MFTSHASIDHALNWRYATKLFDPTKKISEADWAILAESLVLTPSSFGLQPWKFIVVRDDALSTQPDGCADLVLLNPPFHVGSAVHPGVALKLFEEAARVLRPGGELWTVFNSHLSYRAALTRAVGATRQVGRNAKFTVTVSTR